MLKKLLVVLLLTLTSSLYADTLLNIPNQDIENIDLVRINNILNAVYPLLNEAQAAQDKNARVIFNYLALRNDLQLIQYGIVQKINKGVLVPRIVTPLQNDFLTNQVTIGGSGK